MLTSCTTQNIPVDFLPVNPPCLAPESAEGADEQWARLLQLWQQYKVVVVPALYSLAAPVRPPFATEKNKSTRRRATCMREGKERNRKRERERDA